MDIYLLYGNSTEKPIHKKRDELTQRLVTMDELEKDTFDYSAFEGVVERSQKNQIPNKRFHVSTSYLHIVLKDYKVISHTELPTYSGEEFAGNLIEGIFISQNPLEQIIAPNLRSLKKAVNATQGHIYFNLRNDKPSLYVSQITTQVQ